MAQLDLFSDPHPAKPSNYWRERKREQFKRWRKANRAKLNEKARQQRASNPELAREKARRQRAKNPERDRERCRRRRAAIAASRPPKAAKPEKIKAQLRPQSCIRCGADAGLWYRPRYCSVECRKQAGRDHSRERNRRVYNRDVTPRPCKECKEAFTPIVGEGRRIFCCDKCQKRWCSREHQRRHPNHNSHRKRARRYGVAYVPGINWRRIMDRDGNECALCGFPVPASCSRGDPLSPTIDHKVALARGGGHTWENVQLAHRICNSYKCDDYTLPEKARRVIKRLLNGTDNG